ncbi:MAG: ABC transporter permease [Chloroflexota bacterium]|nr:ABC transporter permease [Chloroflexota bacterium]MDE2895912.1 ABC transporter permease [Chloroflexota bacterium]
MSEAQEPVSGYALQDEGGFANWVRDQMQLLIDRSVSGPIGFLSAVIILILAGSVGFLVGVVVMPYWMYKRKKYLGAFGAFILLACVVVAAIAPLIQTVEQDPEAVRVAPYTKAVFSDRFLSPNADHVMGTDNQGRDIVSRIVYGSEVTVLVGIGSVLVTAVLSTVIGLVSGYFAGSGASWSMRAPRFILDLPIPFVWWLLALPFATLVLGVQILFKLVDMVTLGLFSSQLDALLDDLTRDLPSRRGPVPDVDIMIQRIVDVWNAFPAIFLILAVIAIIGAGGTGFLGLGFGPAFGPQAEIGDEWFWQVFPRTTTVVLTVALVLAAGNARVVRGAVLATRAAQYVEAARTLGASNMRIMVAHIVPNIMATIIILASLNLGAAVLIEAAISFLGFGIPPPFPTWGRDLGQIALIYATEAPWMAIFPGLAIMIAVFGFNMMGDALRDILDPRLRGT